MTNEAGVLDVSVAGEAGVCAFALQPMPGFGADGVGEDGLPPLAVQLARLSATAVRAGGHLLVHGGWRGRALADMLILRIDGGRAHADDYPNAAGAEDAAAPLESNVSARCARPRGPCACRAPHDTHASRHTLESRAAQTTTGPLVRLPGGQIVPLQMLEQLMHLQGEEGANDGSAESGSDEQDEEESEDDSDPGSDAGEVVPHAE